MSKTETNVIELRRAVSVPIRLSEVRSEKMMAMAESFSDLNRWVTKTVKHVDCDFAITSLENTLRSLRNRYGK